MVLTLGFCTLLVSPWPVLSNRWQSTDHKWLWRKITKDFAMDQTPRAYDPLSAFRLDGKIAVVTGGGSGIGRAAAVALAAVGARVAVVDINPRASAAVAAGIVAATAHHLDVGDEPAVERCFAAIAGGGPISVLVNSAGISRRKPALDLPLADWQAVNTVNVTGSFLCARAAARHMTAGGSIVNIASVLGFSGGLYPNVAYQTSKGAVINLTRALAIEWAAAGIRVNGVAPGYIDTPFLTNAASDPAARARIEQATPLGRIGAVEEVIGAILLLASPASSFMTGHTIVVDGGFLAR
jgi:NAD(P)-dependent dehydrogenase (short-subunit alcohol dehydrogenase family)